MRVSRFFEGFDSVPHLRLLTKLQSYGISGSVWSWISSFLKGRKQKVVLAGTESDWSLVTSGVPQGSVLGPVLFVCFINDMSGLVSSFVHIYADDTKISRDISCDMDADALQSDINELIKWSKTWQLGFNASKCKVMHIGNSSREHNFVMQDEKAVILEGVNEECDLGIWFDKHLKFSTHVRHVVEKANKILGLIKRSFVYLDCDILKMLFTGIVRPSLEYGNVVWHPRYKKDIELLERVQQRATKLVPELRELSYEERLRILDLPSLEYRRLRGDVIEAYKYVHSKYSVDNVLLPLALSDGMQTRGHCMKIRKRQCSTSLRLNFFSFRIVNIWNSLPHEIVMAPSVNCLKGRLHRHWSNIMYSTDIERYFKF